MAELPKSSLQAPSAIRLQVPRPRPLNTGQLIASAGETLASAEDQDRRTEEIILTNQAATQFDTAALQATQAVFDDPEVTDANSAIASFDRAYGDSQFDGSSSNPVAAVLAARREAVRSDYLKPVITHGRKVQQNRYINTLAEKTIATVQSFRDAPDSLSTVDEMVRRDALVAQRAVDPLNASPFPAVLAQQQQKELQLINFAIGLRGIERKEWNDVSLLMRSENLTDTQRSQLVNLFESARNADVLLTIEERHRTGEIEVTDLHSTVRKSDLTDSAMREALRWADTQIGNTAKAEAASQAIDIFNNNPYSPWLTDEYALNQADEKFGEILPKDFNQQDLETAIQQSQYLPNSIVVQNKDSLQQVNSVDEAETKTLAFNGLISNLDPPRQNALLRSLPEDVQKLLHIVRIRANLRMAGLVGGSQRIAIQKLLLSKGRVPPSEMEEVQRQLALYEGYQETVTDDPEVAEHAMGVIAEMLGMDPDNISDPALVNHLFQAAVSTAATDGHSSIVEAIASVVPAYIKTVNYDRVHENNMGQGEVSGSANKTIGYVGGNYFGQGLVLGDTANKWGLKAHQAVSVVENVLENLQEEQSRVGGVLSQRQNFLLNLARNLRTSVAWTNRVPLPERFELGSGLPIANMDVFSSEYQKLVESTGISNAEAKNLLDERSVPGVPLLVAVTAEHFNVDESAIWAEITPAFTGNASSQRPFDFKYWNGSVYAVHQQGQAGVLGGFSYPSAWRSRDAASAKWEDEWFPVSVDGDQIAFDYNQPGAVDGTGLAVQGFTPKNGIQARHDKIKADLKQRSKLKELVDSFVSKETRENLKETFDIGMSSMAIGFPSQPQSLSSLRLGQSVTSKRYERRLQTEKIMAEVNKSD